MSTTNLPFIKNMDVFECQIAFECVDDAGDALADLTLHDDFGAPLKGKKSGLNKKGRI